MVQEEMIRKGPWTEQEDGQLVFYVNMFGDRRWDFVAKVSGLKRTGKSCRLRWVNYLHPGLKRGKMTPHEERLVLELHSKWGNRWSRIARKLPGRTDNEIKNYWRTHMRKEAQEKKKTITNTTSTSSSSSLSTISSQGKSPSIPAVAETKGRSFYDTGGFNTGKDEDDFGAMDDIWKDIELCDDNCVKPIFDGFSDGESYFSCQPMPPYPAAAPSPLWNVSLWATDDPFYSFYNQDSLSMLTG